MVLKLSPNQHTFFSFALSAIINYVCLLNACTSLKVCFIGYKYCYTFNFKITAPVFKTNFFSPLLVGWHRRLDGHESEQAPGGGDGQGSLACCSPWAQSQIQLNNSTIGPVTSGLISTSSQPMMWHSSLNQCPSNEHLVSHFLKYEQLNYRARYKWTNKHFITTNDVTFLT